VSVVAKKKFVSRPEIGPKHFEKFNPNPARPEKPSPTYNSAIDTHRQSAE